MARFSRFRISAMALLGLALCIVGAFGWPASASGDAKERPEVTRWQWVSMNEKYLYGLLAVLLGAIAIVELLRKKPNLPPGPFAFPIVGNWPQVGSNLSAPILGSFVKQFGEIYMLKMGVRHAIVVSSPALAKEILHTQGIEFGSRSRSSVIEIFTGGGQDMAFTLYGEHWRKMRRVVTVPFFTRKALVDNQEGWEDEINTLIEEWKSRPESSTTGVPLKSRLQFLQYNILFRMMFDRRFSSEEDPLFLKVRGINMERAMLSQGPAYNFGEFVPLLKVFLRKYFARCKEVQDRRLKLFKDLFLDPRKKTLSTEGAKAKSAAIDYLLKAVDTGEITEQEVLYIIENVTVAGIETTFWAMEWGIAQLINNPHIQSKLRNELDSTLGRGNLIKYADIPNTPYLTAIVKETLRTSTPTPVVVPHMNLKPTKIGPYDIPARTEVFVNSWYIANDPANWDEPEKFNPDRFINSQIDIGAPNFVFIPFGGGRRGCPGLHIAMEAMHLLFGRLVQTFDLLPPPGLDKVDLTLRIGQFTSFVQTPFNTVLKPRSD